MEKQNIAIIGLGRIGSAFLREMLRRKGSGITLVCAAEIMETPGKARAVEAGIKIVNVEEMVAMGDEIDVIFELSGLPGVRRDLRQKLGAANNWHTVIASESIARLIWTLISDEALPVISGRNTGY